ncbi:hypothetical protein [Nocardioides ferulae]|uniref:hypothetical protein n=1 Tax=Nocardioides ferulae TaxID=2340821 RepID=UPI000F88EEBB|nr:hypothetical protein [Nocardioides ferulae]
MRPWSGSAVWAVLLVLVLVLGGCGDDDPQPPAEPSSSASDTASGSPTSDPSTDPEASPSVEPASGPVLRLKLPQMNIPEGWKLLPSLLEGVQARAGRGREGIILFQMESLAAGEFRPDLEARLVRRTEPQFRRLPDTFLDREPAIHMRAPEGDSPFVEHMFVTQHLGHSVRIRITAREARENEIVESILATFEWRR